MAGKAVLEFEDREWKAFIVKLGAGSKRLQEFAAEAYKVAGYRDIIEHFRKEEGPKGLWPERADATQIAYAKKGWAGNKLLQATGNLRQSVLPTNVENVGRDAILVYANAPYGRVHDEGSPGRGLPQREFMWISGPGMEKMAMIVLELLAGETNGRV